MRELGGGAIVNFFVDRLDDQSRRMSAYSAAKAAIVRLTKSLAREFGPDNIRVNAIAPGAVITGAAAPVVDERKEHRRFPRPAVPRSLAAAEDVARMALFLAAGDSAMITKQCFLVDGGIR